MLTLLGPEPAAKALVFRVTAPTIWGANQMEPALHFREVERRQLAKVPNPGLVAGKSPKSRTLANPSGLHGLIPQGESPMGDPPWGYPIGDLPWGLPHGGIPPHGDPPWGIPMGDSHVGSPMGDPPQGIPHKGCPTGDPSWGFPHGESLLSQPFGVPTTWDT